MSIPKVSSYPMPSSMPENRVNWLPDPSRAALLIHDMQDYFLDFYDRDSAPIPSLIAHILQLRACCDALGIPVFYSAQPAVQSDAERGLLNDWWGAGLTAKPERAGIMQALAPLPHHTILTKWRYSAFARNDFAQQLQQLGRNQLMICGVYAHIGCLMTAAEAFMQDIQAFMIGDAVADFSAQEHQNGLDYVAKRCAVVLPTVAAVSSLQKPQKSATPSPGLPNSLDALQQEVAKLLMLPAAELPVDENLMYCGLDSIRIMSLLERWQSLGSKLSFMQLAQETSLQAWWNLLSAAAAQGNGASSHAR